MQFIEDGYFIISRKIFESAIWRENPDIVKLFIYLIGNARHDIEPKKYPGFEIKRGELVTSLNKISDDNEYIWYGRLNKWSKQKVSRILAKLQESGYIKMISDTYGTHIKICNYDVYQEPNNYIADSSGTVVAINKKDNKVKRLMFISLWEKFWNEYPKKKGKKDAEDYFFSKTFNINENKFSDIMTGLDRAINSHDWQKDNGQYIPLPATFLRKERWRDEYKKEVSDEEEYIVPDRQ